jgi:hypothetical protein
VTRRIDTTLTDLQVRVYRYLRDYWNTHGFAPTQAMIRKATMCSPFGIRTAIIVLRERGYIVHEKFTERGLAPVDPELELSRERPNAWDLTGYEGADA